MKYIKIFTRRTFSSRNQQKTIATSTNPRSEDSTKHQINTSMLTGSRKTENMFTKVGEVLIRVCIQ